jgi:hypothetical protein
MKKLAVTLVFSLISLLAAAQARLGTSASDIKAEFSDSNYKLTSAYNDERVYTITVTLERSTVLYYFNKDFICNVTFIIPNNQTVLNYMVEYYNKNYVVISTTEWKMYSKNGICRVELVFGDDLYFFAWRAE